ncbi:MAG: protein-glutamate O-methyltransferase CheR [Polyangiaceae bacterium]
MALLPSELCVVQRLVFERAAIVLRDEQSYLVESRLTPLAKESGCDLSTLVARIGREPHGGLHERVVEAMTTNETSFFRDRHPFAALKDHVLPELLLGLSSKRRLRVWSAACSSGQEAYSLLMLMWESFPLLKLWDVKVLGTDLASKMVERARSGVYTQLEIGRGLPSPMLVKYFERSGLDFRVNEELRRRTEWQVANLTRSSLRVGHFDLIFLRNVLIYFNSETRARVLSVMAGSMHPTSYLFLGSTETTHGACDALEAVTIGKTTAYRLKRQK